MAGKLFNLFIIRSIRIPKNIEIWCWFLPVKLLPLADALSSLSAVHDEELPVSLRTETELMHIGFNSSHRSVVVDGDGDGCCCCRRLNDLVANEL